MCGLFTSWLGSRWDNYNFQGIFAYVNQKNTLNLNKILMEAEFIKKIKILPSETRLRERLRLEPCTGD